MCVCVCIVLTHREQSAVDCHEAVTKDCDGTVHKDDAGRVDEKGSSGEFDGKAHTQCAHVHPLVVLMYIGLDATRHRPVSMAYLGSSPHSSFLQGPGACGAPDWLADKVFRHAPCISRTAVAQIISVEKAHHEAV